MIHIQNGITRHDDVHGGVCMVAYDNKCHIHNECHDVTMRGNHHARTAKLVSGATCLYYLYISDCV